LTRAVVAQMKKRFEREPRLAEELWSAAYILMCLRYHGALIQTLLQGVTKMEESVTYQAILREGEARGEAKGEAREARKLLLLQGRARFGEPSAKIVAALDALIDLTQLEALAVRLLQASSWEELLRVNGSARRSRGRKNPS
jgi:predicted transposase YdaD